MKDTKTQSLTADEVRSKIINCKGQFVKVKWQSNPKPAASFKSVQLTKITEGVCRAGIDYSNLKVVKEGVEDGSRDPVGELPWGNWKVVDGVSQFPYVIEHKGSDYLRLYPSVNNKPHSVFYVDGQLVPKKVFATYLTNSEANKLLSPSDEDVPLCFTIKADNILSVPEEV